MAEDAEKKLTNYGSNSNKSKIPVNPEEPSDKPRVSKVIQGEVRQKAPSLGRKFKDTFGGEKADNVLQYVVLEVILPATKNLIFDVVREGAARMLFGGAAPRRTNGAGGISVGRTNYNGMSSNGSQSPSSVIIGSSGQREISNTARAMHDFKDIILEKRGDAEEVLEQLSLLVEQFDVATVADLYSCVGISAAHTDNKYGWTSLAGSGVHQVREGYWIELPRPVLLP